MHLGIVIIVLVTFSVGYFIGKETTRVEYGRYIKIDKNTFKHYLNCLSKQRYIDHQDEETQIEWNKTIKSAWEEGIEILKKYES